MSDVSSPDKQLQKSDKTRIVDSIVASVENAQLETEPFEHFRWTDILPPDVYDIVSSNFPDRSAYSDLQHKDARLADGTVTRKRFALDEEQVGKLPPALAAIWSVMRDALCDDRVKQAIFSKFRVPIEQRIRDKTGTMRVNGDNWENAEAYPRPALFRDETGYLITPHPDTPLKIVTVQIYLPTDSSQQHLGTSFYRRKKWHERLLRPFSGSFTEVKRVDFLPNSGHGFAVTEDSFHGREEINAGDGIRHTILLFYFRDAVKDRYSSM